MAIRQSQTRAAPAQNAADRNMLRASKCGWAAIEQSFLYIESQVCVWDRARAQGRSRGSLARVAPSMRWKQAAGDALEPSTAVRRSSIAGLPSIPTEDGGVGSRAARVA